LLVMGAVGSLGVYSNNNLLHTVFGLMIGLLLVSGWVSRAAIGSIEVDDVLEGSFFANTKGGLWVRFADKKPKRPRCLEIHLDIGNCRVEPSFLYGGDTNESPMASFPIRPMKRGMTAIKSLNLRTRYPFGFLEKIRCIQVNLPVLVAPRPVGYERQGGDGELSEPSTNFGFSSPVGARPFVLGDSVSRIHWKRTAQRGVPWVRVLEGDKPKGILLKIDLAQFEPGDEFEEELEMLSGSILQARLQKMDITLTVLGQHGKTETKGHIRAWKKLATLEAEG
jgi:uncharacterized protein (DUF58 family)